MARKPLECRTIVANVLKHGTGALDIDGCRIPTNEKCSKKASSDFCGDGGWKETERENNSQGRFPANILCTDDALNDGEMTKGAQRTGKRSGKQSGTFGKYTGQAEVVMGHNDSGSKSRYFDIDCWAEKHGLLQFPKASRRERNEGCDGLEEKTAGVGALRDGGRKSEGRTSFHPTVKPVPLMAWLVRLVSKEGDTVLDPFMGSGSTGVACRRLNRNFIGIELEPEYFRIAEARINAEEER